ncbi:MAG TPA: hypothetical protein PLE61_01720 [Vicinamibacterales bacterium]|nr:hypothetical protein [Vicinamibacterales bacterium]HPW19505.1 hypothetical protein [Vicinamibacterales bacterium]
MRNLKPVTVMLALLAAAPASAQYRTLDDHFAPPRFTSRADWEARAAYLREHVLASAGLLPMPPKTPLNPVVFDETTHDGYSVSKVYFESLPGFYVTGNLYKPAGEGPFPAVLSPHGHWAYGRLENSATGSLPGRGINLARLGMVVFMPDMVGYNDSRQLPHTFGGKRESLWGLSLAGLQLWNNIRGLDFLQSLPYVRKDALGATGASGGGSQTFLLAAVDERVAVSVPVNMISLHMQGGCLCENMPGLRLDTTNVEIAAAIAPRPLLMVSATGDWTRDTLEKEYPAVRAIYALLGAEDRVSAVRFTAEHNYNKDSREAMYAWMARWLQGAPAQPRLEERAFSVDRLQDLLVFHGRALPEGALTPDAITAGWIGAARQQLTATPLSVRASALRHALAFAAERAVTPGGAGATAPGAAARAPARRRPAVLIAGDVGGAGDALRAAGFTVRPIAFAAFDAEAAARIKHFDTYNRTPASQRVADIVSALRAEPNAVLVAAGDEALAGALASAIAPPRLAVLDVKGFDAGRDEEFVARVYIPGLRRAGDFRTAADLAPGRLVIHGAGEGFDGTGARIHRSALSAADIVALVREEAKRPLR